MTLILLVDSQPVLRKGIRTVLDEAMTGCEFGEAGTGNQAMQMLQQANWDLAIVQIALPDIHWVELIRRMKLKAPKIPILAFCRYPEEQYGTRCIKLGASGYVSKTVNPDTLVQAVRSVLNKGVYMSPKVSELLALEASHQATAQLHDTLSNREYEIFRMLTSGITVSDIAEQLALSVKTVSTHRKRILNKMGMKTNADLTHYAQSIGLVY